MNNMNIDNNNNNADEFEVHPTHCFSALPPDYDPHCSKCGARLDNSDGRAVIKCRAYGSGMIMVSSYYLNNNQPQLEKSSSYYQTSSENNNLSSTIVSETSHSFTRNVSNNNSNKRCFSEISPINNNDYSNNNSKNLNNELKGSFQKNSLKHNPKLVNFTVKQIMIFELCRDGKIYNPHKKAESYRTQRESDTNNNFDDYERFCVSDPPLVQNKPTIFTNDGTVINTISFRFFDYG